MDDIIIYLIFLAFALLSRFLTKKKEQGPPPAEDGPSQRPYGEGRERPKSFEELLREFTEEQEPVRQEKRERTIEKHPTYEEEPYEEVNYEEQYARDEEAKEVYQRSVKQAKGLKTIDELVDYDKVKTTLDSKRFDAYSQEKKETLADKIRRDLQNPHEVRKAVIYAEILQRKY